VIFRKAKKRTAREDKENLLMTFPSNSRFAESYRTLRTNLFFSLLDKELKSVVVTSTVEKEGKTTTAVNLAYTIAQADNKVLVLDCDLRRPHLSTLFSEKQEKGVTGLITDVLGSRVTKGSLDQFSISDLIVLTRLQQRSCCLDIADNETRASISFEKGVMTDIYWRNRPDSKKLANALIREKLLTEKQASLALDQQKKSVQRLGSILLNMGFVSKKDILRVLSVHMVEAARAVASMNDGRFAFSALHGTGKRSRISWNTDFEKLYSDFIPFSGNLKYIKKSINAAINKTGTENLYILPAGSAPPNPSEMIASKRMEFLIEHLKKSFDFIVIDTPPVMPATDAMLMAPRTDGTILVIKSGATERKIIQDAIDQYKTAQLPIIGTVLNQVDMKKEGYYRYYSKYYSAYYGK